MNGLVKLGLQGAKMVARLAGMGAIYTITNELQQTNKNNSRQFNKEIREGYEYSVKPKFKLIKNDDEQ